MSKIKVTAVTYINTKPFLYGLFKSGLIKDIDLHLDIPSTCAKKLSSGMVEMGLVPVAAIPEIKNAKIISDFCIGAEGAVKTVCIYSDCPIEHITDLYLDHHSRTSVELAKILMRKYWHIRPNLLPAYEGYIRNIGGTQAGLVIGDRAIGLEKEFEYVYDLSEIWEKLTRLPFVFAAWVSTKKLSSHFIRRFNRALQIGLDAIPELMYLLPNQQGGFDLKQYFMEDISYKLDGAKKQALQLFLDEMAMNRTIEPSLELA